MISRAYADRILSRIVPKSTWRKHCFHVRYKKVKKSVIYPMLIKNHSLKCIHKGERCFILGSGPSLSKLDLSLLKDEVTFTMNELYYQEHFEELNTTYHLFADPFYAEKLEDNLRRLYKKAAPKGIFFEGSIFAKVLPSIDPEKYPIYVYSNGMEVEDLNYIPIDLCKMLPYYCTVVQSAITIAVYMGFSEIYLLGCDCTGIINFIDRRKGKQMSEYAYSLPEEEQKKQQTILITSEHMFYEWYHIFKSYRILREVLHDKNIRLINLTEDSILDSLEKGNFSDVISSEEEH